VRQVPNQCGSPKSAPDTNASVAGGSTSWSPCTTTTRPDGWGALARVDLERKTGARFLDAPTDERVTALISWKDGVLVPHRRVLHRRCVRRASRLFAMGRSIVRHE
jgi:hypothetical protein